MSGVPEDSASSLDMASPQPQQQQRCREALQSVSDSEETTSSIIDEISEPDKGVKKSPVKQQTTQQQKTPRGTTNRVSQKVSTPHGPTQQQQQQQQRRGQTASSARTTQQMKSSTSTPRLTSNSARPTQTQRRPQTHSQMRSQLTSAGAARRRNGNVAAEEEKQDKVEALLTAKTKLLENLKRQLEMEKKRNNAMKMKIENRDFERDTVYSMSQALGRKELEANMYRQNIREKKILIKKVDKEIMDSSDFDTDAPFAEYKALEKQRRELEEEQEITYNKSIEDKDLLENTMKIFSTVYNKCNDRQIPFPDFYSEGDKHCGQALVMGSWTPIEDISEDMYMVISIQRLMDNMEGMKKDIDKDKEEIKKLEMDIQVANASIFNQSVVLGNEQTRLIRTKEVRDFLEMKLHEREDKLRVLENQYNTFISRTEELINYKNAILEAQKEAEEETAAVAVAAIPQTAPDTENVNDANDAIENQETKDVQEGQEGQEGQEVNANANANPENENAPETETGAETGAEGVEGNGEGEVQQPTDANAENTEKNNEEAPVNTQAPGDEPVRPPPTDTPAAEGAEQAPADTNNDNDASPSTAAAAAEQPPAAAPEGEIETKPEDAVPVAQAEETHEDNISVTIEAPKVADATQEELASLLSDETLDKTLLSAEGAVATEGGATE